MKPLRERTGQQKENLLAEDLDHILQHTRGLWEDLRDKRLFITGGTGFFGSWLLESFAWANEKLALNASALVLTRNPEGFFTKAPHLATNKSIQFHKGDVRSFEFPPGSFDLIIHAATEASAKLNNENPLLMLDTIVEGTRHTLDFARHCGARTFLLASSGAIYGKQPPELTNISEEFPGAPAPECPSSAYGEGKRIAEHLCTLYARQFGIEAKIARCFAFVGPYLPLDTHFAIGNFIRDGLRSRPIHIQGDGTPYRSYLYAADLAIWLWTILFRGKSGRPYNVGSEQHMTIADLAKTVAHCFHPAANVQVAGKPVPGQPAQRYVPATKRAETELNLHSTVDLQEAISRTIRWYTQILKVEA